MNHVIVVKRDNLDGMEEQFYEAQWGVLEPSKHQEECGWMRFPLDPFQLDSPWLVKGLVSLLSADPSLYLKNAQDGRKLHA